MLGPEPADLDYLKLSMEGEFFTPAATVLVVNTGLLVSGRSAERAFAEVCDHRVVVGALEKGAKLVRFPALACMSVIIEQGLSFADAMRGDAMPGHQSMTFLDQARVQIFWEDYVPAFFTEIPAECLPAMAGADGDGQQGGAR